jgi:hypothetical protein
MMDAVSPEVGVAIALPVMALAFLKGDEPERVATGGFMLGLYVLHIIGDPGASSGPWWGVLTVDAVFLLLCAAIALKSRRTWAVWATAVQALLVARHLPHLAGVHPPAIVDTLISLSSFGVLAAIAAGVLGAWRDRRVASPQ